MVTLSDEQRERFQNSLGALKQAQTHIENTVAEFGFPETYSEFCDLMKRQQTAITQLLETGELGCELATLEFDDSTMTTRQDLKNLAFASSQIQTLPEAEKEASFEVRQLALHDIKNLATKPQLAFRHLEKALASQITPETGNAAKWNR